MEKQELKITFTQSEEQWLEARGTRFTASEIHKLMGSSRSGSALSKTAETYIYEKAAEILTGHRKEVFGAALDWGKDNEANAFHTFNTSYFNNFTYYGGESYVFIPYGEASGYSPDGLSDSAIVEIKCPFNSAIHLKNFSIYDADSLKNVHPEYYWQMQLGMLASDLDTGFFVSYDPRFPQEKVLHVAEIERHDVEFEINEKLEIAHEFLKLILQ
jgi:hypothetical protein